MAEFIKRQVEKEQSILKTENIIKDALEKTADKRYIILEKYIPWQALNNSDTLFVIYPS